MNQDFCDLLSALSNAEARYLVVGAYALAVHGWPRGTGDIDIWIEATSENAQRVLDALSNFGAPTSNIDLDDLSRPGLVLQLGFPPRRIDLLTSISGIADFEAAWQKRVIARFGDLDCSVIGRDDLIANKRATGRLKDLADIEALEKSAR